MNSGLFDMAFVNTLSSLNLGSYITGMILKRLLAPLALILIVMASVYFVLKLPSLCFVAQMIKFSLDSYECFCYAVIGVFFIWDLT